MASQRISHKSAKGQRRKEFRDANTGQVLMNKRSHPQSA